MHAEAVAEAQALERTSGVASQQSTARIVNAFEAYHPLLKSFLTDMLSHHQSMASARVQQESVATNAKVDKLVALMQVRKALEDVVLKQSASAPEAEESSDDPEFVRVADALRGAVDSTLTKMRRLTERAELPDASKRLEAIHSMLAKADPGDVPTIAGACSQIRGVYDGVKSRCAPAADAADAAAAVAQSPDEARLESLERRTRLMMMREMGEAQSKLVEDDLSVALARASEAKDSVTRRSKDVVDDMLRLLQGGGTSVSALLRRQDGELATPQKEAREWSQRASRLSDQMKQARAEQQWGERDLARMALVDPQYETTIREIVDTARSLEDAHRELQTRQLEFDRDERSRETLERLALEDSSREKLGELALEADVTEARIVEAQSRITDGLVRSATESLDRLRSEMGRYIHTLAGGSDAMSSLEDAVRMSTHDIGERTRVRILAERLPELAMGVDDTPP